MGASAAPFAGGAIQDGDASASASRSGRESQSSASGFAWTPMRLSAKGGGLNAAVALG